MAYGDNPLVPEDIKKVSANCATPRRSGYMAYDPKAPRADKEDFKGSAYLSLCPDKPIFLYRVSLKQQENGPVWGRVDGKPDGAFLPGFGCSGMLDRDTGYMEVIGSTVLHEIFHWPRAFKDVPGYAKFIKPNGFNGPQIVDYTVTPWLTDPYGPWNAMRLNQLPLPADPVTGKSQSIQNVENYVWYALSKYWSWVSRS